MIPMRVKLKGFLTYRDEVEFCFDGASLWMLVGLNGAGKSSVFDAITYCLFGLHRGGKSGDKYLIIHHCDELRVEFEFSVDGRVYIIRRRVPRKGDSERAAFDVTFGAHGRQERGIGGTKIKEKFNEWVKTLRIYENMFTASVLLQQGKSDA